jgi:hypothetical protein
MTRATKTWLGMLALTVGVGACGGARQDRVGTTTTTGGEVDYVPGSVELYVGRRATRGQDCSRDLSSTVEFGESADGVLPAELVELDKWAACLNRPELAHTTVVVLGADEPGAPAGLFVRRALRLRELLGERGVDSKRVVIGAPAATRAGGHGAPTRGVRMEITGTSMVRALDPPDPGIRYGVQ